MTDGHTYTLGRQEDAHCHPCNKSTPRGSAPRAHLPQETADQPPKLYRPPGAHFGPVHFTEYPPNPAYLEFTLEEILIHDPKARTRETEVLYREGIKIPWPPLLFQDKYNFLPAYLGPMTPPLTLRPNRLQESVATNESTSTQIFGVIYITLTGLIDSMVPVSGPWAVLGKLLSYIVKLAPILWWALPAGPAGCPPASSQEPPSGWTPDTIVIFDNKSSRLPGHRPLPRPICQISPGIIPSPGSSLWTCALYRVPPPNPAYSEYNLETILIADPLARTRSTEYIGHKGKRVKIPPLLFKDKYNYLPVYFVPMTPPLTPIPDHPLEPTATAKTTSTQLFGVLYINLTGLVNSVVPNSGPWFLLGQSLSCIIKLAPILWWALPAGLITPHPEPPNASAYDWLPDKNCLLHMLQVV
ncbi:hypothetical protein DSO57_1034960 [Entomophthora muscae]|uniref:Uncharacterized protein n=1 Tax=Entomophthora muscae TaxID=34485 RepID=A0ACC2SCR7_9FUNG|nr:hypothetical protein DSO57_1034960 [Entomophthora muscae]